MRDTKCCLTVTNRTSRYLFSQRRRVWYRLGEIIKTKQEVFDSAAGAKNVFYKILILRTTWREFQCGFNALEDNFLYLMTPELAGVFLFILDGGRSTLCFYGSLQQRATTKHFEESYDHY